MRIRLCNSYGIPVSKQQTFELIYCITSTSTCTKVNVDFNWTIVTCVIVYRPGYFTVHPPPRLQVDQNFLTQKIVADPKMRCHQKSFGIWRVTEAILGKKNVFFFKKHILEKIHNKSHYFFNF